MARNRDYYYREDDIEQTRDGFGMEHCSLGILDLSNSDPSLDVSIDKYVYFMNIQCGKQGGGAAKPTVEQWEYVYFGSQFFTFTEFGFADTYYSFPIIMTDAWFGGISATEVFPLQFVILSGGTT